MSDTPLQSPQLYWHSTYWYLYFVLLSSHALTSYRTAAISVAPNEWIKQNFLTTNHLTHLQAHINCKSISIEDDKTTDTAVLYGFTMCGASELPE